MKIKIQFINYIDFKKLWKISRKIVFQLILLLNGEIIIDYLM